MKKKETLPLKKPILKAKLLENRIALDAAAFVEASTVFSSEDVLPDNTVNTVTEIAKELPLPFDNIVISTADTPHIIGKQIVFVDASVKNHETLLGSVPDNAEIYMIEANKSGLQQITNILQNQRDNIAAIHILSHGQNGAVQLGDTLYNNHNISSFESQLVLWRDNLTSEADILFYGCNIGANSDGLQMLSKLSSYTGADIAASDDVTGSTHLGGDWDLEVHLGEIDTQNIITLEHIPSYNYTLELDIPTIDEVLVNTETSNTQTDISLTTLANGEILAVWQSDGQDGANNGVYGQIFDAEGQKIGSEFRINQETNLDQQNVEAAALQNGGFVITWQSDGQDGANNGVFARLYNADYTTYGNEFQVNTTTAGEQTNPNIAVLDNGRFVVTWESADSNGIGIFAQLFTSTGNKVGSEFQVNSDETGAQQSSDIISLNDGGFLVAWETDHGGTTDIAFQRYNATAGTVGSETIVNTTTANTQHQVQMIQLANDRIVFAWTNAAANSDIYYRVYAANLTAITGELTANSTTANDQTNPTLVDLADNGFTIMWQSDNGEDGSNLGIIGRQFDNDGSARNTEFIVNQTTAGDQTLTATSDNATRLQNGRIAMSYQHNNDVYLRVFSPDINLSPEVGNANISLTAVAENAASVVTDVSNIITDANITDAEGATLGIAVTNTSGPGLWEFSLDGGTTWSGFGAVSTSSAVLLDNSAKIRFIPQTDVAGSATITFFGWDQTTGSAGDRNVNAAASSNFNAFSSSTSTGTHTITAVNDSPQATADEVFMSSIINDGNDANAGQTVAELFQQLFNDNDGAEFAGIALVGSANLPTQGNWLFSQDGGTTWQNLSNLSDSNAVVLNKTDLLRYSPTTGFSGQPGALSVRLWDGSASSAGTSVNISGSLGSTGAFTSTTQSLEIQVFPETITQTIDFLPQDFTFFQNTRQKTDFIDTVDTDTFKPNKINEKSIILATNTTAGTESQSPVLTLYNYDFDIFSQVIETVDKNNDNPMDLDLTDEQLDKTLIPDLDKEDFEEENEEHQLPKPGILNGPEEVSEESPEGSISLRDQMQNIQPRQPGFLFEPPTSNQPTKNKSE